MIRILTTLAIGFAFGALAMYHYASESEVARATNQAIVATKVDANVAQAIEPLKSASAKRKAIIATVKESLTVHEAKNETCPLPDPVLPGSVRVLHDLLATGEAPDPGRMADAAPVPIADLTGTIEANYTACNDWRDQLMGWQAREVELQKGQAELDHLNRPWWAIWR